MSEPARSPVPCGAHQTMLQEGSFNQSTRTPPNATAQGQVRHEAVERLVGETMRVEACDQAIKRLAFLDAVDLDRVHVLGDAC